jgi:hypothetical protein
MTVQAQARQQRGARRQPGESPFYVHTLHGFFNLSTWLTAIGEVAACVSSPLRLARIADFRVHSGQLHVVGLPCRTFAIRTRIRALPAWSAITAAGPVSLDPGA